MRVRKDWVYSTESYASVYAMETGPLGIQAIPLVYSQNAQRVRVFGTAAEPTWGNRLELQSGAVYPDHSKQRIYAVDGWIRLSPGEGWIVGAEFVMCFRLQHGEMDVNNGAMAVQTGFSTMVDTADMDAAQSANAGYLKEWRYAERVNTFQSVVPKGQWMKHVFWSSNRGVTLGNDRGLYMVMEMLTGSITSMQVELHLRTLMRAPLA